MLLEVDPSPAIRRRSVIGGARLRYRADDHGHTQLQEQWVRPPLHMSKSYLEHGWAISQLMSPTAGLLEGDLIEIKASVDDKARAGLISPAACRVHTMDSGHATVRQNYTVGNGAIFDLWPAPMILQEKSSLVQETQVDLAADSTVILCEIVSPGRVTFGEAFKFSQWRSRLRIRKEGRLIAYENFSVDPSKGEVQDWRNFAPSATYASIYFISPKIDPELFEAIHNIDIEGTYIGASSLRDAGLGIKILADDGVGLRKAIATVRSMLIKNVDSVYPKALQRAQTFFN